jgi:hypothetical protein
MCAWWKNKNKKLLIDDKDSDGGVGLAGSRPLQGNIF